MAKRKTPARRKPIAKQHGKWETTLAMHRKAVRRLNIIEGLISAMALTLREAAETIAALTERVATIDGGSYTPGSEGEEAPHGRPVPPRRVSYVPTPDRDLPGPREAP